ncbi:hypothetical protein EAI_00212 [Harpegnathos saltator]|uniref:Uncharacterized protein n=1 Tax=Harpegnathos saltator TaxID=610380 RepID=E2BP87_HARSA|nr:hypothetical protein EAI_00212 [Harpegnathos saltator]
MDITKTLFPYSGKWMSIYYNKIFHPNLCHICKKTREVTNLTTCDRCLLISYCSEDHKNLHLPQHREICTAIEKYLRNNSQYLTRRFSQEEWLQANTKFYFNVIQDLWHMPEAYERQMFNFARLCFICHQQTGLYSCKKCLSVDYCLEHKEKFEELHHRLCDALTLWLNLELSNVQYEITASLSLKFMNIPDCKSPFNNMEKFIEEYIQDKKGEWNALDYIYSDYVSGPLSVYYGMYHAGLFDVLLTESTCIIHIIGAESIERDGLPAWEILLHLFSNIQVLIVVLLGTDLQFEFESGMQEICPRCTCNKKTFIYECCSTTYSDYMVNPTYGRANLIVGFHAVFETVTWDECLETMQSQECPVLLTTPSERISLIEITETQKVLGKNVCPVNIENEFASLRPYRDFKYIYYRNSFLNIYKILKNTSCAIENSSNYI